MLWYFLGTLFLFACLCDVDHKVCELNSKIARLECLIFDLRKHIERLEEMVGDQNVDD